MLNVAILMGRLVADPKLNQTQSHISKATFSLAVEKDYGKPGEKREVDFIDCISWRNTAEFICKYFHKGQLLAVQGSIKTRTYTDTQGNKRKAFEVEVDSAHFSDSRPPESQNYDIPLNE